MRLGNFTNRSQQSSERGYILLVVLLMVFMMALASLAVAPSVIQQGRRDKEQEMIHRGAQYARAIKKFVRKFGRYPTRLEELDNTNNIRFLRQHYKDPMTQSGEWHLIHFGEVQLARPGVGGSATSPPVGQAAGGPVASQPASAFGGPATQPQSAFSGPATSGGVLGGGPIIGVASTSEQKSIREFNGKSHYNQWQFIYDPTTDRGGLITGPYQPLQQLMPGVNMPGMQTPGQTGQRPAPGTMMQPGTPTVGTPIRP